MILVKPSYEIWYIDDSALKLLELAGRTCYKSEDRITDCTAEPFVNKLIHDYKHESVIEHANLTVKFIIDRGVSHELVRHRLCAFSQESTRYCNYGKKGVCFVIPPWTDFVPSVLTDEDIVWLAKRHSKASVVWLLAVQQSAIHYETLLAEKWSPQQARSVLPNSLKTEIVVTANFREWRHIFKMRTAQAAHPQMREVMVPLCKELAEKLPVIFDGILS